MYTVLVTAQNRENCISPMVDVIWTLGMLLAQGTQTFASSEYIASLESDLRTY